MPCIMISAVSGKNIKELKELLWRVLNSEENRVVSITHRNLDVRHRQSEEDDLLLDIDGLDDSSGNDADIDDDEWFYEDEK